MSNKNAKIIWLFSKSGTLKDRHVWALAKKFTNVSDLRNLTLTGLKLKGLTFDAKMYNNERDIWEAANKILQEWCVRQDNKHKAYTKLLEALKKCGFVSMANELEDFLVSSSSEEDEQGWFVYSWIIL